MTNKERIVKTLGGFSLRGAIYLPENQSIQKCNKTVGGDDSFKDCPIMVQKMETGVFPDSRESIQMCSECRNNWLNENVEKEP